MPDDEERRKRMNIQPGDFKIVLPQCADCTKNTGPHECQAFVLKPDKYVDNEFQCPEKITK